ncbi:MAG: hypothetical protein QXQ81_05655 [Candidatus Thorarchaeota archaeon]
MPDPVKAYCTSTKMIDSGDIRRADLAYGVKGLIGVGASTRFVPNGLLILDESGVQQFVPTEDVAEVEARHILTGLASFKTGPYTIGERMYPPPTHGWYYRLMPGVGNHRYFIHPIVGSSSVWLTVVDREYIPVCAHPIQPHELASLYLKDDSTVYAAVRSLATRTARSMIVRFIETVVDGPPPEDRTRFWSLIRQMDDIELPKNVSSMRDLLEPLVPATFPPRVREEYMQFLALFVRGQQLDLDPVDVFLSLASRPVLSSLMGVNMKYEMEGIPPPQYVRVINDAERANANVLPGSAVASYLEPWYVATETLVDNAPDWTPRSLRYITDQPIGKGLLEFPVTRAMASTSRELMMDRAALVFNGYNIRTRVDFMRIGLEKIVYSGRAYTWPHRYLEKWIELKDSRGRTNFLRVMTVPRNQVAVLEENLRNVVRVDHETATLNPSSYDVAARSWTAPFVNDQEPVDPLSVSEFQTRTGGPMIPGNEPIDREEARAMDLTSNNFYIDMLENPSFLREYQIDVKRLENTILRLTERGIVKPFRSVRMRNMPTLLAELRGEESAVCGLSMSLLRGTPRAHVLLGDGGRHAYITMKVPQFQYFAMHETLRRQSECLGVEAQVSEVTHIRSYLSTMYQRLLRKDCTWDTDLSEVLSQITFTQECA